MLLELPDGLRPATAMEIRFLNRLRDPLWLHLRRLILEFLRHRIRSILFRLYGRREGAVPYLVRLTGTSVMQSTIVGL